MILFSVRCACLQGFISRYFEYFVGPVERGVIVGGIFNDKDETKSEPPAVIVGGEGWRRQRWRMPFKFSGLRLRPEEFDFRLPVRVKAP